MNKNSKNADGNRTPVAAFTPPAQRAAPLSGLTLTTDRSKTSLGWAALKKLWRDMGP